MALPDSLDVKDPKWIERMQAINDKLKDPSYKVVKQETLPDGKWISTIWLGLDHGFYNGPHPEGPALIFETMVFTSKESLVDVECERYSTEEEAVAGHERIKAEYERIRVEREKIHSRLR